MIGSEHLDDLEKVIEEFPYFQAARAIHLKALKEEGSFKYNNALKQTAAFTADRSVLFDFITSEEFTQHTVADNITRINTTLEIMELPVEEEEEVIVKDHKTAFDFNKVNSEAVMDPELFKPKDPKTEKPKPEKKQKPQTAEEKLSLGKPLEFNSAETHSFTEWLKLSKGFQAIDRSSEPETSENPAREKRNNEPVSVPKKEVQVKKKKVVTTPGNSSLDDKIALIDKFIKNNPKIQPPSQDAPNTNLAKAQPVEKNELMTETLARVYLEQKKYKKAIQAYKILSLKYPEKSGLFADQIKAIRNLKDK